MQFHKFNIHATPHFTDAYCECGGTMRAVMNGFTSVVLFCPKCENVYAPRLIKIARKKVTKAFLEQARRDSKA